MRTITLLASALYSKWGFQDGDILGDCLMDGDFSRIDDHGLLEALVREFLLPKLPMPIEIEIFSTCHNPVRAAPWPHATIAPENENFSVDVPYETIWHMAGGFVREAGK